MNVHDLKTWPEYLTAMRNGKNFEVRYDDRDYQIGDVLLLRGWDPATGDYTGDRKTYEVTYIFSGDDRFGCDLGGYVVMGVRPVTFTTL